MINKLYVATSLLMLTTSAIADFLPAPYVGGGLGIVTNADSHFGVFRGLPLHVFAGYGGLMSSRFYLAGEFDATVATGDLANHSFGLESNTGYMFSALPGFMLNEYSLGFIRAGIVKSHFQNPSESIYGSRFGFGLATSLMPNVLVRAEYDFTLYQDLHRIGQSRSPRSDGGNVDMIYKFG